MGFTKDDGGKIQPSLVPPRQLFNVTKVFTMGAVKYEPRNYQQCKEPERYYNAFMRHMLAWQLGEDLDPESGLPHLAHATTNLMILAEVMEQDGIVDFRKE